MKRLTQATLALLLMAFAGAAYGKTVTISSGSQDSEAFYIEHDCVLGIGFPSTMDGANLSAKCAATENGTYRTLTDSSGNNWSIGVNTDKHMDLTQGAEALCGCSGWIKLRSDASETSDRTLNVSPGR